MDPFARVPTRLPGMIWVGLLVLVWICSHAVPRRDDTWVFGALGGEAVHGNSKYLYLHAVDDANDIQAVWVGHRDVTEKLTEAGYPAVPEDSIRGIWQILRARVICNSHGTDVPWWATGGATLVQLWHGNGIKRIGWASDDFEALPTLERLFHRYIYWNWSYAITTSTGDPRRRLARAFSMDDDRVLVTGYPRTDALLEDRPAAAHWDAPDLYADIARIAADRTVVTYCPTYRNAYGRDFADAPPPSELDLPGLEGILDLNDATLFIKLHPRESLDVDLDQYEHIELLPRDIDVMPILADTDVLLTDYSSIYLDYLLLDRPIVFYPYDRDRYLDEQDLYFNYEDVTPGPVVEDAAELTDILARTLSGEDTYAPGRASVRRRFHDYRDRNSAPRVLREIHRRLHHPSDIEESAPSTSAKRLPPGS